MAGLSGQRLDFSVGNNKIFTFDISAVTQNNWFDTGYVRTGQYQHSGAFAMINFSNQDGDSNNLFGMARSAAGTAYLGGQSAVTWSSLAGSAALEMRWQFVSGSTYKIQVRTTSGAATGNTDKIHGMIFISDA